VKILIVEDSELAAQVMRKNLIQLGARVDIASNAEVAIDFLMKRYDLILIDIGLPKISGYSLAQIIRREEEHRNILIAIPSVIEDDRSIYWHSGFDDVCIKPITKIDLQTILTTWLTISDLHLVKSSR
jgi:two-component system response regulator QseB